jgi:hypothetical protein
VDAQRETLLAYQLLFRCGELIEFVFAVLGKSGRPAAVLD